MFIFVFVFSIIKDLLTNQSVLPAQAVIKAIAVTLNFDLDMKWSRQAGI